MSHGLGSLQRLVLFRLADHELRVAEAAAERQRPYRPPDRWALDELVYSAFYDQVTAQQRAKHDGWQEILRRAEAGDKHALEYLTLVSNLCAAAEKPLPDADEFKPNRPDYGGLKQFNPSRTLMGLTKRGFVLRDEFRRKNALALTVEGFAEARRLGGLRNSEMVDLDRMQENWRESSRLQARTARLCRGMAAR